MQSLAPLLDSLGGATFEPELLRYLRAASGGDHYTVYRVAAEPEVISGASVRGTHAMAQTDRTFQTAKRSFTDLHEARSGAATVVHTDPLATDDVELRSAFEHHAIVDRVLLCGQRTGNWYAISVLRAKESGPFAEEHIATLTEVADVVVSAVAKHTDFERVETAHALRSVVVVEARLKRAELGLSTRELQVMARILFGLSALGIACDLGLSEETITTYRKRAYQRLRISGRHDLLQLYLHGT